MTGRTFLALEIGSVRFALTTTGEGSRLPFAAGALTGLGAMTLALAGATAAPRIAEPHRYSVTLAVPDPVARPVGRATRTPAAGVKAKRAAALMATPAFGAGDERYVREAMATGAMQEWTDSAGQLRFLTAGPARVSGERTCRDMALLVRLGEGGSRVRSAERCFTTRSPLGSELGLNDDHPDADESDGNK